MQAKKILIIDDDREMADLVRALLNYYGYEATAINDPKKGISFAQKDKPDLILLDVLMPTMNGREVCRRLKEAEKTKDIPVIFLTAKDSPDDVEGEKDVGGSGHLQKPFDSKKLLENIKKLCG